MALNESGGYFLHRWYSQEGENWQRPSYPGYLLISLELFLLLKSSTIGPYPCYLAKDAFGKQACKYRVFSPSSLKLFDLADPPFHFF